MSMIPEEELKSYSSLNLAPMVDFLFLVVAVFATLAVTRAALFDSDIKLVKLQASEHEKGPLNTYMINLSVNAEGQYKWITEFNEYAIGSVSGVQKELKRQQDLGLLPKDPSAIKVLLHIDENAKWDPIAQVIFAVRQAGFDIHPVYDRDEARLN